ncbi:MAG: glycosyltransferase family 1 protein [Cellulomonas sp.]
MINRVARAYAILRSEGILVLVSKALARIQARIEPAVSGDRVHIRMLVQYEDAREVDWTTPAPWQLTGPAVAHSPLRTAWIMHPPGESSGGHQNIFRFIKYLEDAGGEATVYLYHSQDHAIDARYLEKLINASASYPDVRAKFVAYSPTVGVAAGTDLIVATGWETAYPAYRDPSTARRAYFVQDFEPSFYPVGTEHALAENTYRFGFEGITAGPWLAKKLSADYGMSVRSFDFGADLRHYNYVNTQRREEIFFYARPVTTRRGFEFGVMALEHVARARPDVTIHLAGWDVSNYDLSFDYVNHSAMKITELNELYNRCAVGLVLSLTNMSLLPLELLASGVIPVVNSGENNSLVSDNAFIEFSDLSPSALARRILDVLDRPDQAQRAADAARSVSGANWDTSGAQFVEILAEIVGQRGK